MKAAAKLAVPVPPEGYFFRIKPSASYMPLGTAYVQLRRRFWWGSLKVDETYASPNFGRSMEQELIREAETLLTAHQARVRRREAANATARFFGDHP